MTTYKGNIIFHKCCFAGIEGFPTTTTIVYYPGGNPGGKNSHLEAGRLEQLCSCTLVPEGDTKALGQEGKVVSFQLLIGDELNKYCKWE